MMATRLRILAFDKQLNPQGPVSKVNRIDVTLRHNLAGSAEFEVDSDDRRVPDLLAPGSHVAIDYYPGDAPAIRLSGLVEQKQQDGPEITSTLTFTVTDHWSEVFNTMVGWPSPTTPVTSQAATEYFTATGPAETVLLNIVRPNVTRLGLPVTVPAASLGRGEVISVGLRMHPIYERLFPAFDIAGMGVRVAMGDGTLNLQAYQPATIARLITQKSKIITNGNFQILAPTATRAVIACGGEGLDRAYRQLIDTTIEGTGPDGWGRLRREMVVTAGDVDPFGLDFETEWLTRAREALSENKPKSSAAITTTETRVWRYGRTFQLGDRVSVKASNGQILADYVREVGIHWDPTTGVTVTPVIGGWTGDEMTRIQRQLALRAKDIRDLKLSL